MGIREKMVERSQPFLEPGEQVRHVFQAQTGWHPMLMAVTYWAALFFKYRVVCVTDRAIVIMESGKMKPAQPKAVINRLPRNVVLGPVSGLWGKTTATGEKLLVHKRFHKDITAADTELQQMGSG